MAALEVRRRLYEWPSVSELAESRGPLLDRLCSLLVAAVGNGVSGASLVVGSRGVGKTALVRAALAQTRAQLVGRPFAEVWLSGAIHRTESLALKEILAHLDGPPTDGNRGGFGQDEDEGSGAMPPALVGLDGKMLGVSDLLIKYAAANMAVVIVLDEFDLFAFQKQRLLYNLVDCLHGNVSLALIGISARVDCVELVEKRATSRAGFTNLYLGELSPSHLSSIMRDVWLQVRRDDERVPPNEAERWNRSVMALFQDVEFEQLLKLHLDVSTDPRVYQNVVLLALCEARKRRRVPRAPSAGSGAVGDKRPLSAVIDDERRAPLGLGGSVAQGKKVVERPSDGALLPADDDSWCLTLEDFRGAFGRVFPDELAWAVANCSALELLLLVIMRREQEFHFHRMQFSFQQLFAEYTKVTGKHELRHLRYAENFVWLAFERLLGAQLVSFVYQEAGAALEQAAAIVQGQRRLPIRLSIPMSTVDQRLRDPRASIPTAVRHWRESFEGL